MMNGLDVRIFDLIDKCVEPSIGFRCEEEEEKNIRERFCGVKMQLCSFVFVSRRTFQNKTFVSLSIESARKEKKMLTTCLLESWDESFRHLDSMDLVFRTTKPNFWPQTTFPIVNRIGQVRFSIDIRCFVFHFNVF